MVRVNVTYVGVIINITFNKNKDLHILLLLLTILIKFYCVQ